jgi:Protein of unknown function DUF262
MSRFTALSLTLGELFADPFVVEAPAYQRPYSWTTKEAGRLLDDLLQAFNGQGDNKDYGGGDNFIGTMLFVDRDPVASHMAEWPRGGPPRAFEVTATADHTHYTVFCIKRPRPLRTAAFR